MTGRRVARLPGIDHHHRPTRPRHRPPLPRRRSRPPCFPPVVLVRPEHGMISKTEKAVADMASDEAPILPSVGRRLRAPPRQPDDDPGQGERWPGQDDEGGPPTEIEPVTREAEAGARKLVEDLPIDPAANTHPAPL